jgi:hypothetical protein
MNKGRKRYEIFRAWWVHQFTSNLVCQKFFNRGSNSWLMQSGLVFHALWDVLSFAQSILLWIVYILWSVNFGNWLWATRDWRNWIVYFVT